MTAERSIKRSIRGGKRTCKNLTKNSRKFGGEPTVENIEKFLNDRDYEPQNKWSEEMKNEYIPKFQKIYQDLVEINDTTKKFPPFYQRYMSKLLNILMESKEDEWKLIKQILEGEEIIGEDDDTENTPTIIGIKDDQFWQLFQPEIFEPNLSDKARDDLAKKYQVLWDAIVMYRKTSVL